jgi:hypothetical protein
MPRGGKLLECTLRSNASNQDFGLEFEDCQNTHPSEVCDSHTFIKVVGVKADGPAADEGTIAVGDTLIQIGDNSAFGRNSNQLVNKTLSKVTTVHLTVFRSDPAESTPGSVDDFEEQTTGSKVKFFVNDKTNEVWWATPSHSPPVSSGSLALETDKLDCGTKDHKHMSWGHTQRLIDEGHPRQQVKEGHAISYKYWPLCSSFGMHWPCDKKKKATMLQEYGVGIVLYFKLMKSMFWLFVVLTILAIPTLTIFGTASDDMVGLQGTLAHNVTKISVASFSEERRVCAEATESKHTPTKALQTRITLDCPRNHKIRQIDVFYGNPLGSCGCPEAKMPKSDGTCRRDGDSAGYEPMWGQPCCGGGNPPNFKDHWPDRNITGCDSVGASDLATSICLGNANCTLPLHTLHLEMEKNVQDIIDCAALNDFKLIAVATCYAPTVDIIGKTYEKQDLAVFVTGMDAFGCLIFLLVLAWLRQKEEEEIQTVDDNAITIGDYSVYIHQLPHHTSAKELVKDLTGFLNKRLNSESAKRLALLKRGERASDVNVHVAYGGIRFALSDSELIHLQQLRSNFLDKLEVMRKRVERMKEAALKNKWPEKKLKKRGDAQAQKLRGLLCQIVTVDRLIVKHLHISVAGTEAKPAGNSDGPLDPSEAFKDESISLQRTPQHGAPGSALLAQGEDEREASVIASRAFVTFEHEEGKLRCLEQFREMACSGCCCGCCFTCTAFGMCKPCVPIEMQFKNRPLIARPAPEPSDVLWENQAVSPAERKMRRYITALATLVCLLLSFVTIWGAKAKGMEIASKYPTVTPPADGYTIDDVEWDFERNCEVTGVTGKFI